MSIFRVTTLSAFFCLWITAPTGAQESGYSPDIGQPHPEITLPRIDTREAVSLSDFRGKKVLLIHFASW